MSDNWMDVISAIVTKLPWFQWCRVQMMSTPSSASRFGSEPCEWTAFLPPFDLMDQSRSRGGRSWSCDWMLSAALSTWHPSGRWHQAQILSSTSSLLTYTFILFHPLEPSRIQLRKMQNACREGFQGLWPSPGMYSIPRSCKGRLRPTFFHKEISLWGHDRSAGGPGE